MNRRGVWIGFAAGVALTLAMGWLLMPRLMLREHVSPFGVDETVARISQKAIAAGWVISSVSALSDSIKKNGGGELPPIRLVNLCQAQYAFRILREDAGKVVSVMMPCTISVYQKADGKTYVGVMNAGLLGTMMGGTVAEVMGGAVAAQQAEFIDFAEP
jgi:uncharacterized protein (DUF302 family)